MAVLLDRPTRWSRVRQHIQQTHGISVNFSGHGGYYSAYNYVKKKDRHVLYSDSHPDVVVKPKTYAATNVKVTKKMEKKGKRMGKLEVAELIVKNSIRDRIHLLQHANALRKEGQPALYKFCIERQNSNEQQEEEIAEMMTDQNTELQENSSAALGKTQLKPDSEVTSIVNTLAQFELIFDNDEDQILKHHKIAMDKKRKTTFLSTSPQKKSSSGVDYSGYIVQVTEVLYSEAGNPYFDIMVKTQGESDLHSAPKIFLLIYFVRHELTFSCAETAPACVSLRQGTTFETATDMVDFDFNEINHVDLADVKSKTMKVDGKQTSLTSFAEELNKYFQEDVVDTYCEYLHLILILTSAN
eukprot:gene1730-1929_t